MKNVILFLIALFPMVSFAQSRQVWMHTADEFFAEADYYNALINYEKALSDSVGLNTLVLPYELETSNQKLSGKERDLDSSTTVTLADYLSHQIADCHLKTFDYKRAATHFEKTSTIEAYPSDIYFLGVSQMNIGEYESAIKSFEAYMASDRYADSLLKSAQLYIRGCEYAMDTENVHGKIIVKHADTNVFNKGMASFAPMFFSSEDRLMFTSARENGVILDPEKQDSRYLCDLYWTEREEDGNWRAAKNFGRPLNSAQHDAAASFSDKDIIYYTRWNDEDRKDKALHLARMVDFKFYESYRLPEPANIEGYQSIHPFVSHDGTQLFFSSDRPGGHGGLDLWVVELDEQGIPTGEAKNLGAQVNSERDEVTPFFHHNSSTLFFSSNGHTSIGGLDIFKSSYDAERSVYSRPNNLGYPINSSKDDSYLIWDSKLDRGYFSSDREECEAGHCYDIYEITNEPIEIVLNGHVFEAETQKIIPNATLTFKDIDFLFESFEIQTDDEGYYRKELTINQEIFIKAQMPTYFADASTVNTKPLTESTVLVQDFCLKKIPKEEIEIQGIEYDFDSDKLRNKSKAVLDELYDFLVLNDNLIVEINSHTDFRGTADYNQRLSKRRAQSCVNYLIKKGLSPDRLKAKGYGESKPTFLKDDNDIPILDQEGERIYLTESYIKALDSEEMIELYHQRNRRTAFVVIGEGFEMKSSNE